MGTARFHGNVFSGLGKGAYYVGHPCFKVRFKRLLAYEPFPGTLNLKLTAPDEIRARRMLGGAEGDSIPAFRYDGQEFSAVKCFAGRMQDIGVALTIPKITEYDETVLEIVAPVRLRDAVRLTDGETVELSIRTDLLLLQDGDRDPVSLRQRQRLP